MVSIIKNFNQVMEDKPLLDILADIQSGLYRTSIEAIRLHLHTGNQAEADKLKKKLLAFTPSARFQGGRKPEFLQEYSGFVILDFDKLSLEVLSISIKAVSQSEYTFASFRSPGISGFKVLVKVNTNSFHHFEAYNQLAEFYENLIGIKPDSSGKDVTRLCFMSWDPDTFINPGSKTFTVQIPNTLEEDIEQVTQQIEDIQIDITNNYLDWLKLCFALIDGLGENARPYFHRLSLICSKYEESTCNHQFDNCLRSKSSGITVRTFFYMAKEHGVTIKSGAGSHPSKNIHNYWHPEYASENPNASISEQTETENPESSITGKSSRIKTNKFHLVRDYLKRNFDIRYNIVSTEFEYAVKGSKDYKPLNENNIFIKMSLDGLTFSLNNLMAFLKSDIIPRFNPFEQYFSSLLPWTDGTDHIQNLASFVKVKPEIRSRFDNHFKKWLVRVIKCALIDTYFNKQAFILVHDKQNSGKSTFCRFLCPPMLSNYIAENLSIDKDSRILLTTNLLINLDELSTLSKIEINSLKSLFSKDKINDRLPYDRKNSIIPRRASFIGSTNQAEFLNDESGSVRWLCFVIDSIDWTYKEKINIQSVWAQAYHLFKTNFPCDLTPEEIKENEEYNRQFHITTPEYELINKFLSPATRDKHDGFMTSTDILMHLTQQTDGKIRLNTNNIGKALKMHSFTREKKYPEKSYGYFVFKKI